jgi:hypothetical protein
VASIWSLLDITRQNSDDGGYYKELNNVQIISILCLMGCDSSEKFSKKNKFSLKF